MTVYFIGAGPGAADLITVRGARTLASCQVCLYAGSLVPRELLAECPEGARLVDTAQLNLDEITAELVRAHEAGQDVARLHSGDPSVFSAVAEQMRRLDAAGRAVRGGAGGARLRRGRGRAQAGAHRARRSARPSS